MNRLSKEEMKNIELLPVSVYRDNSGDCTLGGVSEEFNDMYVMGKGIDGYINLYEALEDGRIDERQILVIQEGTFEYLSATPFHLYQKHNSGMAGGNFIYTSDSRFRRVCKYPVAVHDRIEF